MTPELIAAIKERIALGRTKDEIESEVLATGHSREAFISAYAEATSQSAPLIGYFELITKSFSLALAQGSLFLKTILVSTLLLSAILAVITLVVGDILESMVISVAVLPIICFLLVFFITFGILRALLLRHESVRFRDHLTWVSRHIGSLSLTALYFTVVTQLGYLLLIIPGIILTVYLLFVYPVSVSETRGIGALTRSTALIYGRFWPVLGRFFVTNVGVGVFFWLVTVGIVFVSIFSTFLLVLLLPMVGFGIYWLLCSVVVLYESVSKQPTNPLPVSEITLSRIYLVTVALALIAIVGVLLMAAGAAATVFLAL